MKLEDIKQINEKDDSSRLSDEQFQMAYDLVRKNELDKAEIKELAKELSEKEGFGRSNNSADFVLNRMHVLVHGLAPHGETEARAETMFTIPETMKAFAKKKGIDVFDSIQKAKLDLKNRPKKVDQKTATAAMSEYYKAHKATLPKNISNFREEIIKDIMAGEEVAAVFGKYKK